MADKKVELTVQINAETGQLEIVQKGLEGVSGKAKETQASFSGLTGEAGSLLKSFLPFATMAGVTKFFYDAVKGAEEENQALRRLQGALNQTEQSFENSRIKILTWSSAIQNLTRFSDTEALLSLDRLVRVTGDVAKAMTASKLAMDLSVKSGKPLEETTRTVIDLLNGNQRALLEVNREYGALAGNATTTQKALDNLSVSVKGAAENEQGLTKETLQMRNQWKEFMDLIGTQFTPAVGQLLEILGWALKSIMTIGTAIAGQFTIAWNIMLKTGEIFKAIFTGHFIEALNLVKQANEGFRSDVGIVSEEIANLWKESDKKIVESGNQRLVSKIQNLEEEEKKEREYAQKIVEIEKGLDRDIARINQGGLTNSLNNLSAEYKAKVAAAQKEAKTFDDLAKLKAKINDWYFKNVKKVSQDELLVKADLSLQIANNAIQTFQTLNALGEHGSHAERVRAKALLALQQSVAIGWAIVAAYKNAALVGHPLLAAALISSQIALITAQFAQGMANIDKSASAESAGMASLTVTNPVPGIDTGTPVGGTIGGGTIGTTAGGGVAVSSGGGGGGGNVINVGGIHVNFDVESLSTENVDMVMRKIYEKLRQATIEGVQLAVAMKNTAAKYGGMAV